MGMTGIYIAIENFLLSQIINGEKSILEIDPTQCQSLNVDKSWRAIHYLLLDDNVLENMYDFKSMQEKAVYPLHGNEN